jgi:hypothetical protein
MPSDRPNPDGAGISHCAVLRGLLKTSSCLTTSVSLQFICGFLERPLLPFLFFQILLGPRRVSSQTPAAGAPMFLLTVSTSSAYQDRPATTLRALGSLPNLDWARRLTLSRRSEPIGHIRRCLHCLDFTQRGLPQRPGRKQFGLLAQRLGLSGKPGVKINLVRFVVTP